MSASVNSVYTLLLRCTPYGLLLFVRPQGYLLTVAPYAPAVDITQDEIKVLFGNVQDLLTFNR